MDNSIILIDFDSLWHRHHQSSSEEGEKRAHANTLADIRRLSQGHTYSAVAVDSYPCWRQVYNLDYKVRREARGEVAKLARRATQLEIGDSGFHFLEHREMDACDMIASAVSAITSHFSAQDCSQLAPRIVIATTSLLLLSLVRAMPLPKVEIINPVTGKTLGEGEAFAQHGVRADLVRDMVALCGDGSSDHPGLKSIGIKSAQSILNPPTDDRKPYHMTSLLAHYRQLQASPAEFPTRVRNALDKAFKSGDMERRWKATRLNDQQSVNVRELLQIKPDTIPPPSPTLVSQAEPSIDQEEIETSPISQLQPKPKPMTTQPPPPPSSHSEPAPPSSVQGKEALITTEHVEPSSQPTAALALVERDYTKELEPSSMGEAKALAKHIHSSQLFAAYGKPEDAFLVIMAGREYGMGAMTALRSFHLVKGKPCMSAQAMMGLCLTHHSCETFEVEQRTSKVAEVKAKRRSWASAKSWTFTMDDAKQAKLSSDTWSKYPRAMLLNRCIAEACRFWFPDVVGGLYTSEEMAST